MDGYKGREIISDAKVPDDTPVDGVTSRPVSSNWAYDHAADLDAHMRDFLQLLRTGEYLGFPFCRGSEDWAISANTLYAVPLLIAREKTGQPLEEGTIK